MGGGVGRRNGNGRMGVEEDQELTPIHGKIYWSLDKQ